MAGDNYDGELALGNGDPWLKYPRYYTNWTLSTAKTGNVKAIACGGMFSACLTKDGYVYTAGYNYDGEMAIGSFGPYNVNNWTQTLNGSNVSAIACGAGSIFQIGGGNLCGAGFNYYGQLGVGDTTNRNQWTKCP